MSDGEPFTKALACSASEVREWSGSPLMTGVLVIEADDSPRESLLARLRPRESRLRIGVLLVNRIVSYSDTGLLSTI